MVSAETGKCLTVNSKFYFVIVKLKLTKWNRCTELRFSAPALPSGQPCGSAQRMMLHSILDADGPVLDQHEVIEVNRVQWVGGPHSDDLDGALLSAVVINKPWEAGFGKTVEAWAAVLSTAEEMMLPYKFKTLNAASLQARFKVKMKELRDKHPELHPSDREKERTGNPHVLDLNELRSPEHEDTWEGVALVFFEADFGKRQARASAKKRKIALEETGHSVRDLANAGSGEQMNGPQAFVRRVTKRLLQPMGTRAPG
eukprot:scaffold2611_cov214-Pinguiococcus_pyrenoidosus.AAC.2